MKHFSRPSGFALIITLLLLALLVLALLGLSALVRINRQISMTGAYQTQAQQHALLGLNTGLSELQRHAGADDRVTGMAGITGAALGGITRNWCGIWRTDGSFAAWLTSGAQTTPVAALRGGVTAILLVANGSVGASANNSEQVVAGKIPVMVAETPGAPGVATAVGSYAYLVIDEGVKVPVYAPAPLPVIPPLLHPSFAAQATLNTALGANAAGLPKVVTYEQLAVLPPATLTAGVLRGDFHHVTLTSRLVRGGGLQAGIVNVNTTSIVVLRSLLLTGNSVPGVSAQLTSASITSKGVTMQNGMAGYATAGKSPGGPFLTVTAFGDYLGTVFPAPASPDGSQIMAAIGPMLAVRSDTFRIRGYGEALNPANPARVESVAQCEALVQRTPDPAPDGLGRKFVILHFRWLGPDDI